MRTMHSILPSKRLIASYIFDWIIIVAIAAVGGGWNYLTPFHRPFSLVNLEISYPFQEHEKIPTWLLVFVSLVVPAILIFFVCLIFVPGPTASKGTPKSLIWKRKFWEWHTGWMGLGLSLATAFMITQGMKNLFGKPRPDLLSRCQADMSAFQRDRLSTYAQEYNPLWALVSSTICQQPDKGILDDGFRSFPSGHSSFSWAGLLYLTLFLCSKFTIAIPFLPPRPYSTNTVWTSATTPSGFRSLLPSHNHSAKAGSESSQAPTLPGTSSSEPTVPIRNQSAAPPVFILVLALIPICSAIYISSTRFTDFRHHGFDILFGSLIGIVCAWFSFRWYHLPIRQGAGWAWGPRSRERAWGIGVGRGGYVGTEGWRRASSGRRDGDNEVEHGQSVVENERRVEGENAV